jgi:protein-tyrosine phosphatase
MPTVVVPPHSMMEEMEGLRDFLVAASKGGGRNFRTIGNWVNLEGRRVLHGRVFRSGHLGTLAEDLRAEVSALGLRTVVTLQTQQEIDILGDPVAALLPEACWEHIPIGDRWFQKGSLLPEDTSSQGAFYVAMVRDHPEEWTRFLRLFAEGDRYSILYHCTAGRDRTGVATLLLLETLRVPRAEIVADYLVSNRVFQENVQEPEVLEPLFRAIDRAGGIERFLQDLGLRRDEVESIRANLTSEG